MFVRTCLRIARRALKSIALVAALAAVPWCAAQATPRWSISPPLAEGKQSPLAGAPLQKQAAHDRELAERYPVHVERVEVEGFRDPDARREPPRTAEQRFADVLNEGSPELVAGKSYNGYYYDGTLFWASDPLSFAWKNVTHWLKR
ncbi:MAG: hypothetical protein ABI349_02430 [Casimicrobiaceae bacterium]|nr:hypothetical protein [Pseudomonadota bacterium]